MTPQTIEFATPTDQGLTSTPWASQKQSSYQDLILQAGYAARRYKFPPGATWFRILPPLRTSAHGWMLGLHVLNYPQGRHIHPKTLNPGAKSVYDLAYGWYKENRPLDLFSKANKLGFRLLSDPVCIFWILVEVDGKTEARIVLASGYDGSRGGAPGLGHQILKATEERDENGQLVANPVDPMSGVQICIERTQPSGSKYPSYALRIGRTPAPMSEFISRMDQAEIAAIKPLEEVVHVPTEDEEWKLLEYVIEPATVAKIRASQQ